MDTRTITITGRLGRDAETKAYGDGTKSLVSLAVACGRGFGDKKNTIWFKATSFRGNDVSFANSGGYRKGAMVSVSGELNEDVWTDQAGVEKRALSINVFDLQQIAPAPDAAPQYQQQNFQQPQQSAHQQPPQQAQQQWPQQQQAPAAGPKEWQPPNRQPAQPQAPAAGGWNPSDDDIPF